MLWYTASTGQASRGLVSMTGAHGSRCFRASGLSLFPASNTAFSKANRALARGSDRSSSSAAANISLT
ncbi:hypothetical protein EV192_1011476 [Actinocrispum wychmicini]|uniref:Uncharacterized protein n=1 Tax=Actinocrispum wychmicini TaxID=1213861 RepID=A0A4R2K089_9PSEU|nr:hypothetical protein EV192_1011476 [Actinocrispum wychmicini]